MRTEKVTLFGTYFFAYCKLGSINTRQHIDNQRFKYCKKTKISHTFAMSNNESRKRNGSDSFQ